MLGTAASSAATVPTTAHTANTIRRATTFNSLSSSHHPIFCARFHFLSLRSFSNVPTKAMSHSQTLHASNYHPQSSAPGILLSSLFFSLFSYFVDHVHPFLFFPGKTNQKDSFDGFSVLCLAISKH